MKLNKEASLSILRYLMTAVGAYMIGKFFLGSTIDNSLWEGIAGSVLTAVSVIWGIVDKTAGIEMVQSGLRSVIVFFGSALVGAGVIKDEVVNATVEIVAVVIPLVYSETSKAKSRMIDNGKIASEDLKK